MFLLVVVDNFTRFPASPIIQVIGTSLTVMCETRSGRRFNWLKGNSALSGANGLIATGICECEVNASSLTFRSFRPEEAGDYFCSINLGGGIFLQCPFQVLLPGM